MIYKGIEEYKPYIKLYGRQLIKDGQVILGYTNTSAAFSFKGRSVSVTVKTGDNDEVNMPGLRVYVKKGSDSQAKVKENPYEMEYVKDIVVTEQSMKVELFSSDEEDIYTVKLVKITEAAMSYVAIDDIETDGELTEWIPSEDKRTRVEFIGDSITCGYGVLGAPDSEYTVREEDGEKCYAYLMAKEMNWNAKWASVSGYGVFVEYTCDSMGVIPRVYPYKDWFIDRESLEDLETDQPEIIVINLGTNDSGPSGQDKVYLYGLKAAYESFLWYLRQHYKTAKIVCTLGTLAPGMYQHVAEVVEKVKSLGYTDIYGFELPVHDVENDGMASGHPSLKTHQKDADRLLAFMKEQGIIS